MNACDLNWESAIINDARPDRFGKPRMYALGMYRQKVHVVIFAYLGNEAISVISFRRADEQERNLYDDPHADVNLIWLRSKRRAPRS